MQNEIFLHPFQLEVIAYDRILSIIFTQPLRSGRIWHKVIFLEQSLTGLNSEFSFS